MKYITFENNYIEDCREENDDSLTKIFIDGYPQNEEEEGMVIATVTLTKHKDIIVDWHHNAYRDDKKVLELIEDSKRELRK